MAVGDSKAMSGVVIVSLASCIYGFLLDPNSQPCSYGSYDINCYNRGLTSIPVFNLTSYTTDVYLSGINFANNKLTIIENDAFSQLGSLNGSHNPYMILLNNNNISQINKYAFRGIEAQIGILQLFANSLHSLPEALVSLINLKWLYLYENPIISLNPSVMAKIGHSVTNFGVGIASLQHWPIELHYLNELQNLVLYDIPLQSLDSSAFRGLTHLKSVYVTRSNLTKIPNAVCTLSALTTLEMDENYFFNENKSDVFEPCNHITGTPSVEIINYMYNRVDYFPNIFTMFPSVKEINMHGNGMRFMNEDKFEDNFIVEMLDLRSNQFKRIPSGLNIFKRLNDLRLNSNLIEYVENNDLTGLRNLTIINLAYNPIQFIAKRAFQNNIQLTRVDFSHTPLTTIPAAVTMLPALFILSLEANDIDCTCELAYMKNWNVSDILIIGKCSQTNEPIDQFIKTYIVADRC